MASIVVGYYLPFNRTSSKNSADLALLGGCFRERNGASLHECDVGKLLKVINMALSGG